jgi:phage gpG-like protein
VTNALRVELVGADRFIRTVDQAASDVGDLHRANDATSRFIAGRAAGRAPVVSGRLASSLHPESSAEYARVASNVIYAGVIHWGWAARHIRANEFLVPTAENTEPVWLRYYREDLQRALNKVKGM